MDRQPLLRLSTTRTLPSVPAKNRLSYVLPRLFWMAIGPGLLMVLAIMRLEARNPGAANPGNTFACLVASIIAVRWGTWILGDHRDSFGTRTGLLGPLCYSGLLLFFSGALWVLVCLIASQNVI